MRIAAAIGAHAEASGGHWCLPGGGPLSGRQTADIAGRHLGRPVKLRAADAVPRQLVQQGFAGAATGCPDYMKPVRYNARKLQDLLGPPQMTSYDAGSVRPLPGSRQADDCPDTDLSTWQNGIPTAWRLSDAAATGRGAGL